MPKRTAQATWEGTLKEGRGTVGIGSGLWEGPYSFASRFVDEKPQATNPEELLGAALAACFSSGFISGVVGIRMWLARRCSLPASPAIRAS